MTAVFLSYFRSDKRRNFLLLSVLVALAACIVSAESIAEPIDNAPAPWQHYCGEDVQPSTSPFDLNGNGVIEKSEVIAAINDYLFGDGTVTKAQVIELINLYLFGQPEPAPSPTQWRAYMLDLINKSREGHELAPVTMGNNEAAQKHSESMLEHGFLSHWGLDGLTSNMRYTLACGTNYMWENASGNIGIRGEDWGPPYRQRDWRESLDVIHQGLMDSPGHRRNILYTWHKKVSLGIACNEYTCSVTQNFEGDYITFTSPPSISREGALTFAGDFKGGFTLSSVQVWYHQPPHALTLGQLDATYHGTLGQEPATFIIKPAPPGTEYAEDDLLPVSYEWLAGKDPYTVDPDTPRDLNPSPGVLERKHKDVPWTTADRWTSGQSFDVRANIQEAIDSNGPGVYIIVIWGVNGGDEIPLTNYAIGDLP